MSVDALTDNFKIKSGFWAVVTDRYFLFELLLLLLIPLPIEGAGSGFFNFLPPRFTMSAINWTEGSILHAQIFIVPYQTTDIFTVLVFFRIYFVFEAIFAFLPFNILYGKRVCQESGFNPGFFF